MAMLEQTVGIVFRVAGMEAFKAVEGLRTQQVDDTVQAGAMEAAGSMSTESNPSGTMDGRDDFADAGEGGEAELMLCRENALKKVVDIPAETFVNQIGQSTEATPAPVIAVMGKFLDAQGPALLLQKLDAAYVHILHQSYVMG